MGRNRIKKEQFENNDYKELLKLVGPISLQYLMTSLVSASDAFMLAFLEQKSLSASSLAAQVAFVYSLFFCAFVFGFNVLGAQYYGKGIVGCISVQLKFMDELQIF